MDLTASYVLSAAVMVLPVIRAAAPTTALLIKKLRRSTPGGTSVEVNAVVSASGSSCDPLYSETVFIFGDSFVVVVREECSRFLRDNNRERRQHARGDESTRKLGVLGRSSRLRNARGIREL